MPDLSYELPFLSQKKIVAGIDEAGRGPWAGPVVAAAVILGAEAEHHHYFGAINDSKQLSAAARERLYPTIIAHAQVGVGIASVEEIDHLNILGATKLAMVRALLALPVLPHVVLIDGNQPPKQQDGMPASCEVQAIVKGDSKSLSIAAASIIAKVERDRMMADLALRFPHYSWQKNAGYGTKAHQEGIATYGITSHHRTSFAPIRKILENTSI